MYIVTGGSGFIGSNLVAELSDRGEEVVVCDWMGTDERWRNLAKHEIAALVQPDELASWLGGNGRKIKAIVHMGAISATTETDVDLIVARNVRSTLELLQWCTDTRMPFIYASSAATYGDGSAGFEDEFSCAALAKLRPLNAYGWSKHLIDRRIARLAARRAPLPPQWVGLKFFNVYGPNEYHKGNMQSIVVQNHARVKSGLAVRLFRSYHPHYRDGEQLRDFVCVRDCVDVVLWLLSHPHVSGLFNLGTGRARTWLDLAYALFAAEGQEGSVEFVDMPPQLIRKYQYFTQASMQKLRSVGYERAFTSLEDGVADYVQRFLAGGDPYR